MHATPNEIAAVLDLPDSTSALDLALSSQRGLPIETLDTLAGWFSPNEQTLFDTLFSESTLRRRRQRGKLSPEESDQLVRLAATWLMARDTFGDSSKAQRFLLTEHPLLGGRRPLDLAQASTAGSQAVEQLLGRLKYGSAA